MAHAIASAKCLSARAVTDNKNQERDTSSSSSSSFSSSSLATVAAAAAGEAGEAGLAAGVVAVVVVVLDTSTSSAEPKEVPKGNSREEAPGAARLLFIYISIISNIQTKLGKGFTYLD